MEDRTAHHWQVRWHFVWTDAFSELTSTLFSSALVNRRTTFLFLPAGVVQSNVVTTGSGRRTRTSCLAGVNEFSGPHCEDAADRARRQRLATQKQVSKRQIKNITRREREATSTKGGKWERATELTIREEQRYRRMTESAFDRALHDPKQHDALPYDTSDITDILVRRRSRPC
jgi:hypothetical protein